MNHVRLCVGLSLFVIGMLTSSSALGGVLSSPKEEALCQAANERFACGQRAAILFCKLRGEAVPKGLQSDLPGVSHGTSMLEIQQTLQSHDINCELRRLNPSEFSTAPLPIIVRFLPGYRGGHLGHFVLVSSIEDIGPMVVDPITGLSEVRSWRSFSDAWSGHCILPVTSTFSKSDLMLVVVILFMLFLFSVVVGVMRGNKWISRAVVLAVLVIVPETDVNANEIIRQHERDGINVALLFAAIVAPDLNRFASELDSPQSVRQLSMLEVQKLLEERSLPTKLRAIRFSDLVALRQPAIVLLRRDGKGRSQYAIVLDASIDRVTVLHSGAVVVQEVSEDDFRRAWSGHAIIAARRPRHFFLLAFCALGGLLGLCVTRIRQSSSVSFS